MRLRDLDTIDDFDAVVRLQREVWGADYDDVVPRSQFVVAARTGGILVGADDDAGHLVGFVFSVPGLRHGRIVQWSHMLAVAPQARGRSLGLRLKLAQRERALARGIALIEWTYDPLLAGHARLNVHRLGCVVEAYVDDVYGPSTSSRHRGLPTDRFIASWHVDSPHVARRVDAGAIVARDASVGLAPHVLRTREAAPFRVPHGEPDLSRDEPRLRVEIPADFARMLREAPDLGLAWRHAARRVFHTYFARGYRVVDLDGDRGAPRPSYLLALRPAT
ncbi:MAG: GNAT family N-acetyltransferase [Vicinamibacteraceae bacterium]